MQLGAAGYTDWLFFHLWKPKKATNQGCPDVRVPNTVIYRWAKPFFWYFTSSDGNLSRRFKNKMTHKHIYQEFMDNPKGIVASYLSFQENKKHEAVMEYFTSESFIDFVHNRDKALNGILQSWVEPKNFRNSLIKVVWSSQFCLIERRTNIHDIRSTKVDFYDKLVTFEGLEHNSNSEAVTVPSIVKEIQKTCLGISDHIRVVTGGNVSITRMTLYFKQDYSDQIWLLFCTSLKIFDLNSFERETNSKEVKISLPEIAKKRKISSKCGLSELKVNKKLCVACNYLVKKESFHNIPLKVLIKITETGRTPPDAEKEKEPTKIPSVVKRINPSITQKEYLKLKKNKQKLQKEVKVCEDCFLFYTKLFYHSGIFSNEKPAKTRQHTPVRQPVVSSLTTESSRPNSFLFVTQFPNIPKDPKPKIHLRKLASHSYKRVQLKSQARPRTEKTPPDSTSRVVIAYRSPSALPKKSPSRKSLESTQLKSQFVQETIGLLKNGLTNSKY